MPWKIRRPEVQEHAAIHALVQTVVDEVYGGLWAVPPLPIDHQDWSRSWIAASEDVIVGMTLTQDDWIDDLWVLADYRSRGIGRGLLARAETEIAQRGYQTFWLRVVSSNRRAIRFYKRAGWQVNREFPHETLPINMTEMSKQQRPQPIP